MAVVAFLIAITVGVVAMLLRTPTSPPGTPGTTLPGTTSPSEDPSDSAMPVSLVSADVEDPLLYQPTLIPATWTLCEDIINPPVARTSFCGPDDEHWLTLDVLVIPLSTRTGRDPVPGVPGWTMTRSSTELAIYVPLPGQWKLQTRSAGLDLADVVAILRSVPVVGDRASLVAPYETPWLVDDLADEDFLGLFPNEDDVVVFRRQDGSFQSAIMHVGLAGGEEVRLDIGRAGIRDLTEVVGRVPAPRLVASVERPMIISEHRGRVQVVWVQRGLLWSLLTSLAAENVESMALGLEVAIGRLEVAAGTQG